MKKNEIPLIKKREDIMYKRIPKQENNLMTNMKSISILRYKQEIIFEPYPLGESLCGI
jgi:hypothetical protein